MELFQIVNQVGALNILAVGDLVNAVQGVIRIIKIISGILCFIGILYGGYSFSRGETGAAGHALLGVGLIAIGNVIVDAMFDISGLSDSPTISF